MAVTAYAASGQLALSAFRTTVVGASDSVSMSKLTSRDAAFSGNAELDYTDVLYVGTNVPWNSTGTVGTNNSIPTRSDSDPTPAISVSDLHGAIPWFWAQTANVWGFDQLSNTIDKNTTEYSNNLYWDNVLVFSNSGQASSVATITTGGFTYYRGQYIGRSSRYRIGRD